MELAVTKVGADISIHPSRVGWDRTKKGGRRNVAISIHPSRVGWDSVQVRASLTRRRFQSTHPVWDGTENPCCCPFHGRYFNPPIPCGMGLHTLDVIGQKLLISIHPSRVGWDKRCKCQSTRTWHFNPPIPCGMGRLQQRADRGRACISIHPSRVGWDLLEMTARFTSKNFNPPIPCGMGPK